MVYQLHSNFSKIAAKKSGSFSSVLIKVVDHLFNEFLDLVSLFARFALDFQKRFPGYAFWREAIRILAWIVFQNSSTHVVCCASIKPIETGRINYVHEKRHKKSDQAIATCPRRELNPHRPCGPQDFKSCVSTSFTTRAIFQKKSPIMGEPERKTGLEPATPTLARSCSTKWATSAE